MHLVIVHYHLNRGGVTQVVANHVRSLAAAGAEDLDGLVLVYGGRHAGWDREALAGLGGLSVRLAVAPELDYDADGDGKARPDRLAASLRRVLAEAHCPPADTVIHVHNHSLGKNMSLPGALRFLAEDGFALLLQIHDFAEDFRPANYRRLVSALAAGRPDRLPEVLYPQAEHIHYAVLNRRDRRVLIEAGTAAERVHWLPNPVGELGDLPPKEAARRKLAARRGVPLGADRFVLYPVRGIRRKNLGEALLWAALGGGAQFGFTLPPLNPAEQPSYQRWRRLAGELGLPCHFELGAPGGLSYQENLAAADLLLTTSVAEGFGMVFLEAWLAGRGLAGRDLPEVTADFVEAGLRFPWLRPRLNTPVDWFGWRALFESVSEAYGRVLEAFGRAPPPRAELEAGVRQMMVDGQVDFASLDANIQRLVIGHAWRDPARRNELLAANRWMVRSLDGGGSPEVVSRNAAVVRRAYGLGPSGRRLQGVYAAAASSRRTRVEPPGGGQRVLESLLRLSRFHPIRTEA